MRKLAIFLTLMLILAMAVPAAAKARERVGEQLFLDPTKPATFPQNEPFHFASGWIGPGAAQGLFDFELEVDGVFLEEDFVEIEVNVEPGEGSPESIVTRWVYNFPEGMTGTHTFVGHFYGPCKWMVDNGWYPGPCDKPMEKVLVLSAPKTFDFTP